MKSLKIRIASLIFAVLGGIASLILLMERLHVLTDPNYVPSCSWSPVFSCQGPMASWQSSALFGLPNYAVGLVGFAILAMILIISFQAKLAKWIWVGYFIGVTFALIYCMWLMGQTLYEIGALCIYCMVIWVCAIALFWLAVKAFSAQKAEEYDEEILQALAEDEEISLTANQSNQANLARDSYRSNGFRMLTRITPALMIAHYLIVIVMVYLAFPGYFNYLFGITATPLG